MSSNPWLGMKSNVASSWSHKPTTEWQPHACYPQWFLRPYPDPLLGCPYPAASLGPKHQNLSCWTPKSLLVAIRYAAPLDKVFFRWLMIHAITALLTGMADPLQIAPPEGSAPAHPWRLGSSIPSAMSTCSTQRECLLQFRTSVTQALRF